MRHALPLGSGTLGSSLDRDTDAARVADSPVQVEEVIHV